MASSSSRSNSPDLEDSASEIDSMLNISAFFYPSEENISLVEKIPEDTSLNVVSSENLILPIPATGVTDNASRCMSQQNLVQDNLEQICKLDIVMSWDNNKFLMR